MDFSTSKIKSLLLELKRKGDVLDDEAEHSSFRECTRKNILTPMWAEIDDNMIPYHQYLLDTEAQNVQLRYSADTSDKGIWDSEEVLGSPEVVSLKKMNENPGHVRPQTNFLMPVKSLIVRSSEELSIGDQGIIKKNNTKKPDYVSEWCFESANKFVEQQLVNRQISASNAIFEINKLRQQLQGKDDIIRKLDAQISIMKVLNIGSTEEGYDELSKANIHSRTAYTEKLSALTSENTKLKALVHGKTRLQIDHTRNAPVQQNKKPKVPVNLSTRTKPATESRKPMPSSTLETIISCPVELSGNPLRYFALYDYCPLTRIMKPIAWPLEPYSGRSKGRTVADSIAERLTDQRLHVQDRLQVITCSSDLWNAEKEMCTHRRIRMNALAGSLGLRAPTSEVDFHKWRMTTQSNRMQDKCYFPYHLYCKSNKKALHSNASAQSLKSMSSSMLYFMEIDEDTSSKLLQIPYRILSM
ncbi:hypothetical protein Tco_0872459 [Tanacetum coccineum]